MNEKEKIPHPKPLATVESMRRLRHQLGESARREHDFQLPPSTGGHHGKLPHSHPGKARGLVKTMVKTGFVLMERHRTSEA